MRIIHWIIVVDLALSFGVLVLGVTAAVMRLEHLDATLLLLGSH